MPYWDHEFSAPIEIHRIGGTLAYRVVFLPPALLPALGGAARARMDGEVADRPVRLAWQAAAGGRRYLLLSKAFLRDAGLAVGDVVDVRFRLVGADDVVVPDEVARAMRRDRRVRAAWDALTAGARRGHAHHVEQARTAATRARRTTALVAWLAGTGPDPFERRRPAARRRPAG